MRAFRAVVVMLGISGCAGLTDLTGGSAGTDGSAASSRDASQDARARDASVPEATTSARPDASHQDAEPPVEDTGPPAPACFAVGTPCDASATCCFPNGCTANVCCTSHLGTCGNDSECCLGMGLQCNRGALNGPSQVCVICDDAGICH